MPPTECGTQWRSFYHFVPAPGPISERVDIWRIDRLLAQNHYRDGFIPLKCGKFPPFGEFYENFPRWIASSSTTQFCRRYLARMQRGQLYPPSPKP